MNYQYGTISYSGMTTHFSTRTDGKAICTDCRYYNPPFGCMFGLIRTVMPQSCHAYEGKQIAKKEADENIS